jgi:hypothetical protein
MMLHYVFQIFCYSSCETGSNDKEPQSSSRSPASNMYTTPCEYELGDSVSQAFRK